MCGLNKVKIEHIFDSYGFEQKLKEQFLHETKSFALAKMHISKYDKKITVTIKGWTELCCVYK